MDSTRLVQPSQALPLPPFSHIFSPQYTCSYFARLAIGLDFTPVLKCAGRRYIYEEFVETQGTDVKMYTVGIRPRSTQVAGGRWQGAASDRRRFPVILTFREKEIARRIVLVFKQFVCGFDILRVQENRESVVSFVCDVNGWSFVKNSRYVYMSVCMHV
jgi:inositol hexakisphosphate/diphosphoinositol-pentakisphosphate kinase